MKHISILVACSLFFLNIQASPGQNIWWLISDVNNNVNQLISQAGCGATSLSQADAVAGVITLSTPATTYCLSQSFTAAVVITAADVSLDLNDYTLTGTISINNDRVIVRNGTILAPGAADTCDPISGAVGIGCDVVGTQIRNCVIQCSIAITPGLFGMDGIRDRGINTVIDRCKIFAGQGLPDVGGSADGGIGISTINSSNLTVAHSLIVGGAGSDAVGSFGCGSGGPGIVLDGVGNATIAECKIMGGQPGVGGGVGCGGDGIDVLMDYVKIVRCSVAGSDAANNAIDVPGDGGPGILIQGAYCSISESTISSGKGGNSTDLSQTGGFGGAGIEIENDNATIYGCTIAATGAGGDGMDGGAGGDGIRNNATSATIRNCTISNTGAGGNAGTGTAGADGMAIADFAPFSATTPSVIFSNFAYNIANTTQRYAIMSSPTESGVAITSYGPPVATVFPITFLDNTYLAL